MDSMSEALANRRAAPTFSAIDDGARGVLAVEIDVSLTGKRLVRVVQKLCEQHEKPLAIRSDYGPGQQHRRGPRQHRKYPMAIYPAGLLGAERPLL